MKKILLFHAFFFPVIILSQNWSPIRVNDTMNYKHSDSAYITNSIWVDSSFYENDDSIFYLNRIVKDVPGNPEIALRNQPQFFSLFLTKQMNSVWVASEPYGFMLMPTLPVGSEWDMWNGLQAEITQAFVGNIFDTQDSVKVISLSDGNEIRLSKNFGLLKFPDFENGGEYELVGIQNTEFGESVPEFREIFDFDVGDVFQYHNEGGDPDDSGIETKKITITSKEILPDSYIYQYEGISLSISWWAGVNSQQISGEIIHLNSPDHAANCFPGQIHQLENSSSFNGENVYTRTYLSYNAELQSVTKTFGAKNESSEPYGTDVFYEPVTGSDTLYRFLYVNLIDEPCGLMGEGYGNFTGNIFLSEGCFEYYYTSQLEGYIKDGDTVGTITPDSVLLVGIEERTPANGPEVLVFPNPANEYVVFDFSNCPKSHPTYIRLSDLYGRVVEQARISTGNNQHKMELANLPSGIYVYRILSNNTIIGQGRLLIR